MRRCLGSLALLALLASTGSAQTVLKFDDVYGTNTGLLVLTDQYAAQGITFTGRVAAFCLLASTTDCGSSPSSWGNGVEGVQAALRNTEKAGMNVQDPLVILNSATGFSNGFSLYYTNPWLEYRTVEVWSGLGGTGSLLGSLVLPGTFDGRTNAACPEQTVPDFERTIYCTFVAAGLEFFGTAHSVVFPAGRIMYDDITLGSHIPGIGRIVNTVPEPSTFALLAASLLIVLVVRRRAT